MLENKDAADYDWRVDSVACHLLSAHVKGDMTFTRPMKRVKDGGEGVETEPLWSIEKLRGYLAIVKKSFSPLLSKEVRSRLYETSMCTTDTFARNVVSCQLRRHF